MRWNRPDGRETRPSAPLPDGGRLERASPGLTAFFAGVEQDRRLAVLDLGRATPDALAVYSLYARWIRFADILEPPPQTAHPLEPLANSGQLYDMILAWDLLDRVPPEERATVVEHLARMSATGARLFLVVNSAQNRNPERYTPGIAALDRMSLEPRKSAWVADSPLLPAEVQRILSPFEVVRGFTADIGLREYFAILRSVALPGAEGGRSEARSAAPSS